MPVYEFRCTQCKEVFDLIRSRDGAGEPATCPKDSAPAKRLFSASAIRAPGGGGSSGDDFSFGDMGGGMGEDDMGGGWDGGGMGEDDMGGGWGGGEHGHDHPH